MKPENKLTSNTIEQLPTQYGVKSEYFPNLNGPEMGPNNQAELQNTHSDANAASIGIGLTAVLPTPVTDNNAVVSTTTDDPKTIVANDDDLIEKEWVDRAKKIVDDTQGDPHLQEKEVNKLQTDYLKKRYGREIGVAE